MSKPFITIRWNPEKGAYDLRLEGTTLIVSAEHHQDAQRIAQGIAAWTQLPVIDLAG